MKSYNNCIFECFHFKQERVSEINKRTLGKFIIKLCGNEGAENTTSQKYLRRLLQGCIDSIEKHPGVDWTNAVLEIYGDDGTPYQITAGEAKHRFYVLIDDKGEINIIRKK